MKNFLGAFLLLIHLQTAAQLKFHYQKEKLDIPEWLTNPDYIAANENSEEGEVITIDENIEGKMGNISIVLISLSVTEQNHGSKSVYLGTFNAKSNIIDIEPIIDYTESDWNWTGDQSFEEVEPGIYKYFHAALSYRPAEDEDEETNADGMVLSKADTTISFYKINKDGTILLVYDYGIEESEDSEDAEIEAFDEEAGILKIRETFNTINKNSGSYQKKNIAFDENISLTLYYENEQIRKMIATDKLTKRSEEYYYDNDELIFVFSYNKTTKEEDRYYFNDNKLFRWLKGKDKEKVDTGTTEFDAKETELTAKSDSYSERE